MNHKNRNSQCLQGRKAQMNSFDTDLSFDSGFDFLDIPEKGEEGFSEAKALIQSLVELGYEDVDIIIQVHEKVPKTVADKVLKECRQRGII